MASETALPRVALEIAKGDESWGTIVLELDAKAAPRTVENFLQYVDDKFFDGTIFHRVIPTFMIQGGGHTPDFQPKREGARPSIQCESKNGLKNARGTIAMARTADPHSATSQFFINVADNEMLDYPGSDGWGYCAFGRVVEGMDVVDRIKDVETQANPAMGENSKPKNPPAIKQATRV
ncbi:MAG: peptidylprolyl isomerase [Phycisphaerae bacterium]|nr:peptidylprolyl isomerase [Phycisphaerae bacterium]